MPKYIVSTEWAGYSRGYATYEVEAATPEEAKENWCEGKQLICYTVRDDTESEPVDVKLAS